MMVRENAAPKAKRMKEEEAKGERKEKFSARQSAKVDGDEWCDDDERQEVDGKHTHTDRGRRRERERKSEGGKETIGSHNV